MKYFISQSYRYFDYLDVYILYLNLRNDLINKFKNLKYFRLIQFHIFLMNTGCRLEGSCFCITIISMYLRYLKFSVLKFFTHPRARAQMMSRSFKEYIHNTGLIVYIKHYTCLMKYKTTLGQHCKLLLLISCICNI